MSKAIVLLSAGLDSSVNAAIAVSKGYELIAVTFNYGQKAVEKEIEYAGLICDELGIEEHHIINLDWLKNISNSSLTNMDSVPEYDPEKLDDVEYASDTAKAVWVPNRNGVMINIAASIAESRDIGSIIVGFNKEEAATFPDNTGEYLEKVSNSLHFSTSNHVKVSCFTINMTKKEIVKEANKINFPLNLCWSCYYGNDVPCGKCESCQRFIRATS